MKLRAGKVIEEIQKLANIGAHERLSHALSFWHIITNKRNVLDHPLELRQALAPQQGLRSLIRSSTGHRRDRSELWALSRPLERIAHTNLLTYFIECFDNRDGLVQRKLRAFQQPRFETVHYLERLEPHALGVRNHWQLLDDVIADHEPSALGTIHPSIELDASLCASNASRARCPRFQSTSQHRVRTRCALERDHARTVDSHRVHNRSCMNPVRHANEVICECHKINAHFEERAATKNGG